MIDFLWTNFFNQEEKNTRMVLNANPLFSSLSAKELGLISSMIYRRNFSAGEFIFQPGRGIGMYIIVSGSVNILYGKGTSSTPQLVCQLKEGDFFGETALVRDPKAPHSVSAQVVEDGTFLGFFKPDLLTLIEKQPSTATKILLKLGQVLETRLRKAGEKLSQIPPLSGGYTPPDSTA